MTHCLYARPRKGDVSSYFKVFIFVAWKNDILLRKQGDIRALHFGE